MRVIVIDVKNSKFETVDFNDSYGDVSVRNISGGDKTESSFEKSVENPVAKLDIKCSDGDISIR